MRTLILYTSSTGSTQKYAEAIASGIHGDIYPLKKYKWKDIDQYDSIVYGGWVMGNKIQGIDKFLCHIDEMEKKNVLIFASGMSVVTSASRDNLISTNVLDIYHVRFYQLRGSFDYSKLHFPYSLLMKTSLKQIANDPERAGESEMLSGLLDHPFEYYDQQGVDKILSVLHRLSAINNEQ
jgi:menaquinone-dependent protoporphyrinogen IX oxidase